MALVPAEQPCRELFGRGHGPANAARRDRAPLDPVAPRAATEALLSCTRENAPRAPRSADVFWSSASTAATISGFRGPGATDQALRMVTASLRRSSAWPVSRYAQSQARSNGYTKGEGSGVST